jgi:Holliday junction DNA helicase RuvA
VIGSVRGRLLDRSASGEVLVESAMVGYRVQVAPSTLAALGPVDSEVFLHCHHVQREDAQLLFGFVSIDERRIFEALLSAQGVGPAMALAVLSEFSPNQLRMVVAAGDVDALKRVKGVGAKTAARMIIDLTSKLALPEGDLAALVADPANPAALAPSSEVRSALAGLGYSSDEIAAALTDVDPTADSATALKTALQTLGRRR